MGLFKQLKDMKQSVEAAPAMVAQARQMGAQAQEYAAAQQAAAETQMQQAMATSTVQAPAAGGSTEPIAGVSLELYADISKGLADFGYDQSKGPVVAASKDTPGSTTRNSSPPYLQTRSPSRSADRRCAAKAFSTSSPA